MSNDREKKVIFRRITQIDDELRSGSYPNSEELAAKMEVSPRTILRDIEHLRLFYDAPIEYDYNKRGFYYTEPNFFIKSVMLTEDEVKTITIYDDILKKSNDDENNKFNTNFRKAVGKILAVIPDERTKNLSFSPSETTNFIFEPTVVCDGTIVQEINSAIRKKEIIEVEYWTSNNKKSAMYTLQPLYTFYQKANYYLLALRNVEQDKPGVFSISRMKKVFTTGKHFEIPENFKISDWIKPEAEVGPKDNKIYLFELSFHKDIASEAIEKTYHHNQTIELKKDGTVFVTFRSTELLDVFRWVLGQGSRVKIINPPELVAMMRKEVLRLNQYYV